MEAAPQTQKETPSKTPAEPPKKKLDLSRLEPPADLAECSIEEMTIDGICGVY